MQFSLWLDGARRQAGGNHPAGRTGDDRRPGVSRVWYALVCRIDRARLVRFGGGCPKFDMSGMSVFPMKFVWELWGGVACLDLGAK